MRPIIATVLATLALCFPTGCSTSGIPTYPKPLTEATQVDENTVVLLLAVHGMDAVNYVQLCHSRTPCLNFKFPPVNEGVVALPVPVGLRQLSIGSYTVALPPNFNPLWGAAGKATDYRHVKHAPVDLLEAGVYFLGALNTSHRGAEIIPASAADIATARLTHGALLGSAPTLNFSWAP